MRTAIRRLPRTGPNRDQRRAMKPRQGAARRTINRLAAGIANMRRRAASRSGGSSSGSV